MATTTWKQGTITLTNGSATVTGDGTDWDVAELEGGETLAVVTDPPIDFSMTIQAVVGAEEITLTAPWAGATLIDVPYQITRDYTGAPADAPIPQRGDMNPWAIMGEAFRRLNNAIASFSPAWGSITGTLSDQTDLQSALDDKLEEVNWGDIGGTLSDQTDLQNALNAKMDDPGANGLVFRNGANGAAEKRDIVGTVSESSGVPTGAIIQRGSNANGEFVRFADGTQICWISGFTMTYLNASILIGDWTYPAAFSAAPSGGITFGNAGGNYSNVTRDQIGLPLQSNSATVGQYSVYRSYGSPDFTSEASITNIKLHAIGRWF